MQMHEMAMKCDKDDPITAAPSMLEVSLSFQHSIVSRGRWQGRRNNGIGAFDDLMSEFIKHRKSKVQLNESKASIESRNPLCAQKTSVNKHSAMLREVRVLMERYRERCGGAKAWLSDLKARPAWQKLPQWVEPSNASHCFKCERRVRIKVNCRLGGQVFCSECCTDCIVLYIADEGEVMWGVNGKPGGPSITPKNYSLLPVCCNCSQDLQVIVLDVANRRIPQSAKFLEQLRYINQTMSMLEENVDVLLPKYLHLIEALSVEDNSPKSVEEQNPLQYLARAQADLKDAFSMLTAQFQRLKCLKPSSVAEQKLYTNVMQCKSKFFGQQSSFKLASTQLSEIMPSKDIEKIQKNVSERCLEQLYVHLQELEFELSCLTQIYEFEGEISDCIRSIIHSIKEEHPSVVTKQDSGTTARPISEESYQLIPIDPQVNNPHAVRYIVISQISSSLREYYEQLLEKTIIREFLGTKERLFKVISELESLQTAVPSLGCVT